MLIAKPIWRRFEPQSMRRADSRALEKDGNNIEARMLMIAMTTKSSIKVKPRRLLLREQREGRRNMRHFLETWITATAKPHQYFATKPKGKTWELENQISERRRA
jgi:hypothetical protein